MQGSALAWVGLWSALIAGGPARAQGCPDQPALLQRWFDAVGDVQLGETFGHLVMRAGRAQVGTPYVLQQEAPQCNLASFNGVPLGESPLAAAHCIWTDARTAMFFPHAVKTPRSRDGQTGGAARLYYLAD